MLHKYKYFVVYEEIDNSLRSLNNDSSIVHIKMKNIISKGIKRSMEVDFYKLMDFKYKQKKDMPEAWNIIIGDVDKFLVDFLKNFGIDMDLLYTTNVGVLNISSQNESSILWDVSYWAIYIKYLEFVFWMENEPGFSSKQTLQPLAMKKMYFKIEIKRMQIDWFFYALYSNIFHTNFIMKKNYHTVLLYYIMKINVQVDMKHPMNYAKNIENMFKSN